MNPSKLDLQLLPAEYSKYCEHPEDFFIELIYREVNIDVEVIKQVILDIGAGYYGEKEGVYYHNITHGFDVAINNVQELLKITQESLLWYLIAAFAHDLGHEGLSNEYYMKTNHDLAVTYLYSSPLENMHASKLLRVLNKHNVDISMQIKKKMVGLILATSFSDHHLKMDKMKPINETNIGGYENLVLEAIIHAADIGNPTKDYKLFMLWTEKVQAEFCRERELLNVEPKTLCYEEVVQLQSKFSNFLVKPFYQQISVFLPNFNVYIKKLEENITKLQESQQKEK